MFLISLRRIAVWNFSAEVARLPAIVSSTVGKNSINDSMTKVDLDAPVASSASLRSSSTSGFKRTPTNESVGAFC